MKKKLSIKLGDYELEVTAFENWIEALTEINLGQIKIKIAMVLGLDWPYNLTSETKFSCDSLKAREQIICALLLRYPKGLSKEILQGITGMTSDSVVTYLTSKRKSIAEGIKKENEEYRIKAEWVKSAISIAEETFEKCSENM